MDATTMPWAVGVRFSHASLQVLAEDHAIDLLHIKGPAVDDVLLGARAGGAASDGEGAGVVERHSLDADVLVRPAHVHRLVAVMHDHGWTTAYRFEDGSPFEHAATMTHSFLAPVDVHRRFPGLDNNPADAFQRLWADRHTVDIAGVPCPVPSVTAQRLVLIVHATRAGQLDHPDIRRSWWAASDAERESVQQLASELGADVALAAGTGRLHQYVGCRTYELWLVLSTGERSQVRRWMARVKAAPTRRAAFRTAVHLLVPNPHRMQTAIGRRPTTLELSRAYLARARRGFREVRRAIRASAGRQGRN